MQQVQNQGSMNVVLEYPHNDKFDYETRLVRLNLDEERIADIKSGRGFIISAPKGIKKDIKHQDGIFSSRYGSNSISDVDSFTAGYRCKCGMKRGSVFHGEICDVCGEKVLYVGDDISIVGYLKLKDKYWIIHPNIYCTLAAFIGGPKLNRIIEPDIQVDSDGKIIPNIPTKKDEPFRGIGLPMFKERFDEIMDFYLTKYPAKKIYYDDIMSQKDKVFTHSIAVYSSLLRPSKLDNGSLRYEACNEQFNMLATLVYKCNKDRLKMDQKIKEKYQLLYDIQFQLNSVYGELKEINWSRYTEMCDVCVLNCWEMLKLASLIGEEIQKQVARCYMVK